MTGSKRWVRFITGRAVLLVAGAGLLAGPAEGSAQSQPQHAATGEFKPPTPSDRFRQVRTRNNLVHPPGYVPSQPRTLGDVVTRGDGPTPVVLIAGLGTSWRVFESLMEPLTEEYTVHAVTLPGYGGSSAPPMPPEGTSYSERTWLSWAEDAVMDLIESRGLHRPVIATFYSDAANIALHLANERPDVVGGLLVMTASPRFPTQGAPGTRAEALDRFADQWFKTVTEVMWPSGMFTPDYYTAEADLAEKVWWDVLQPTLPTAIRYQVEVWADDLVPLLAELEVPTTVLSPGLEDFLEGQVLAVMQSRFHSDWDRAAEHNPRLRHHVVEGARFLIWEDRPEVAIEALRHLAASR